ncbi:cation:proton antiporter family protein [Phytohalomonas tamaricis]|uniref:cation:proton antiporter family protein n=1 Tax=Phytohalomonas tamaricis TaxID=2081032 RepID=UPI000D0BE2CA|nr:cation:proton antiporter family protein [Phytohalomonas tamaricis]
MLEAVFLSFAFVLGLSARQVGLPPLVGFLIAGFLIRAFDDFLALPPSTGAVLDHVAHLGVLLMLFTIGLKLKIKSLAQPEVFGSGLLHFVVTISIFAPGLHYLANIDWTVAWLIATALGFSSTVLSAKGLEARKELRAFHGRVAIGILIIQDLIALVVLGVSTGETPSWWAIGLLALPFTRPLLHRLLDWSGHDELMVIMGMLVALVLGGTGFAMLGLSGEIGALVMGALLASHPRAQELSRALWGLKELFLVGFFLQIGMSGLPNWQAIEFALIFALLLPLKGILFFFLLLAFRLRARNAFLTALSLTSYSEFGLILAAALIPEWLVPMAMAVSLSFLITAPTSRIAHRLFERFEPKLLRFETSTKHPDEQTASLGDATFLIMGMGRTGTAAYEQLRQHTSLVIGIDADPSRIDNHISENRNVAYADAEDPSFWHGLDLSNIRTAVLTLSDAESKIFATQQLRKHGFKGSIVAHALYTDEADAIREAGATHTYLTMQEAGMGLATHAWDSFVIDQAAIRR